MTVRHAYGRFAARPDGERALTQHHPAALRVALHDRPGRATPGPGASNLASDADTRHTQVMTATDDLWMWVTLQMAPSGPPGGRGSGTSLWVMPAGRCATLGAALAGAPRDDFRLAGPPSTRTSPQTRFHSALNAVRACRLRAVVPRIEAAMARPPRHAGARRNIRHHLSYPPTRHDGAFPWTCA